MANELMVKPEQTAIEDVKRLVNIVAALRQDVFVNGTDYGTIPGTNDKPVLLLPGMEKLMRALHLRAEYVLKTQVEDFDKPLFFYRYECRLVDYNTGECISTAIGSANSHESKWRWRKANRKCPTCGKETIIKGKQEFGGGWLCFKNKGGCGAKFRDGDAVIESQAEGRVPNEDIFDQINTIDKIAQKRALSSAIKSAANVSMFFTVDLEDFVPYETSGRSIDMSTGEIVEGKVIPPAPEPPPSTPHIVPKQESNPLDDFGLESANAGQPVPPVVGKVLSPSWIKSANERKAFLDWAQAAHSMNIPSVLAALNVKTLTDYKGTLEEAQAACGAYGQQQQKDAS